MRFLIAEDNEVNFRFTAAFLEEYGQCDHARNGEEAFKLFLEALKSGEPYQAILMDILMPVQSGLETLKAIRKYERENGVPRKNAVPIVVLSGQGDMEAINSAKALGAAHYLLKPIDKKALLHELRRLEIIADPNEDGDFLPQK